MPVSRTVFTAVLLPLLLALASCASMSKEECVSADWRVVGETDGAAGHDPQSRFAAHTKACQKIGIVPDQTRWFEGYQQGLVRYCTPLNGLSSGQAGRTYYNVCPQASADGFLRGYRLGRAEYTKRQTVQSLNSQIRGVEGQSNEVDKLLAAGELDEQEARARQFRYRRDIARLRLELQQAERELSVIQRDTEIFASNPDIVLPPRYGL